MRAECEYRAKPSKAVKDKDFSITLNAYFIAEWRDVRLQIEKRNRSRSAVTEEEETKPTPVNPEAFSPVP